MKSKVLAFVSVLLIATSFSVFSQEKKKDDKQKVTFDVSMTCENCKKRIEKNIAYEKGVTDMKVDLPSKTVMVEFKENKTDTVKLKQAFEKLGYEASVHRTVEK